MEPIATEGRPDFSNYGLIAMKIMQKMGLENPVGLKNLKGIKEKGLDEGTKADIRRRGGEAISFPTYVLGYIPDYGTRDGSESEAYESSTTEG